MKHLEDDLQEACVTWFKLQYPKCLIWATPNGGRRDKTQGSRFKRQGVLSGIPDLFIAETHKNFHGLFIEMKIKPNTLTPSQAIVGSELILKGYMFKICYDIKDFISVVNDYLKDKGV